MLALRAIAFYDAYNSKLSIHEKLEFVVAHKIVRKLGIMIKLVGQYVQYYVTVS